MDVRKPPILRLVKGAATALAPTADAAGAPAYRPATWRRVVKVLEDCRQNLERFTRRDDRGLKEWNTTDQAPTRTG
jgi:hypothetical protein